MLLFLKSGYNRNFPNKLETLPKTAARILICPLDWGLGHATRCVPIIRELLNQGAEVIIASERRPLHFLKQEFPQLQFISFEGYNIRYPSKTGMILKMAIKTPQILWRIYKEHQELKKIIASHAISAVISDNRFGLWSKKIPCVFITHQIKIKSPVFEKLLYKINCFFIRKYSECWIPDLPGSENLSGDLSHNAILPSNAFFIGPLSRFSPGKENTYEKKYDLMVIISGPEPQRTNFENIVLGQLKDKAIKAAVVRGVTESKEIYQLTDNITVYAHLNTEALKEIILASQLVLCRPGYSTIMDLAVLNKKAAFIPTPGQTEQEYLAKHLTEKGKGVYFNQNKFSLEALYLNPLKNLPLKASQSNLLKEKIVSFLISLR
ncbi:MAG: glycosyl transferase family 28 [Bacteroidetes bacterium]|nr:glycosyl transferase family 28 [Bacteroidota bacterium]HET6244767.1 glycosyltransferase [Bacteroidia bacterium]